ncbi:MAG: 50S ribosomal protein L28 [Spiroplasma sp.]|nr:50S ribosomal protein L28 [Mycoplasmatales bacterium]
MAKICAATGRKTMSGNNRSHAMNATKRKFRSNLQKKRVVIDGKVQTVYISTRALKSGKGLRKAGIKLV